MANDQQNNQSDQTGVDNAGGAETLKEKATSYFTGEQVEKPASGIDGPTQSKSENFGESTESTESSQDAENVSQDTAEQPEGTFDTKTDTGADKRAAQELAKKNKLLEAIGIDPDSEIADMYQAGVISKEELAQHMQGFGQQQQQAWPQQQMTEQQKQETISDVLGRIKTQGATEEDVVKALEMVQQEISTTQQEKQTEQLNQTINQCIQATTGVLRSDEYHGQLPEELQSLEQQMFLASTDNYVLQEAQKTGNPQRYMNPNTYQYYASKNAERFGKLRDHYIELGKKLQREAMKPRSHNQQNVNPVPPGSGQAPANPPRQQITVDNLNESAAKYIKQQQSSQGVL